MPPRQRHQAEPARMTALAAFEAVMLAKSRLDEWLGASTDYQNLAPRDRRFCRRLATTALRRHGETRAILAQYITRPPVRRQYIASLIMQLAITEIIWLDAPPYAAIDQAVRLARARDHSHLHGLINASLKRIATDHQNGKGFKANPSANYPDWLKTRLIADWGQARADALMAMLLDPPALDLTTKGDPETWAERLGGVALPQGSVRLTDGTPQNLEGYKEGQWWVQDAAASMAVKLLGDIKGRRVIDACAAPGGKTAQMLASGAKVIALDASAKRIERLRTNLARLNMQADIIQTDLLKWQPENLVDAVLIDAPCSATGTIRRHPDILTRQKPPDIDTLAKQQRAMISHSAQWLKADGVLVFATCSLLKAEGEAVLADLGADAGLIIDEIATDETPALTAYGGATKAGLRLMPDALNHDKNNDKTDPMIAGNDGFFMARMRRRCAMDATGENNEI